MTDLEKALQMAKVDWAAAVQAKASPKAIAMARSKVRHLTRKVEEEGGRS